MKNNMKKIFALLLALLIAASMNVTVFAADDDFTGDTMKANSFAEVNYTVTNGEPTAYTEVSGVKLEWSVPVLKYTKVDVLYWDTTTLHWEKKDEYKNEQEVTFTFTNYGSYAVKANVSFEPTVANSASVTFGKEVEDPDDSSKTITTNANDPIIASIVNADHTLKVTKTDEQSDDDFSKAKQAYVEANCAATIIGTVKIDDATSLTTDSGKLGTYTAKIEKISTYTVTVKYYVGEVSTEYSEEKITVDEGTAITYNGRGITIGSLTCDTPEEHITEAGTGVSEVFDGWSETSTTVTKDMTIEAKYKAK